MFFDRYLSLCKERGLTPHGAAVQIGIGKGSVAYWKKQWEQGKEALPDMQNAQRIADFFGVALDYLRDLTDDPYDYENGDRLAEIPLTYVEAANGDMKQALAIKLAAERDMQMEAQRKAGLLGRFSRQDANLIFALWGASEDIDEQDVADVRAFAEHIKERKSQK